MEQQETLRQRARELAAEIKQKEADLQAGKITKAAYRDFVRGAVAESEEISATLARGQAKARYSWGAGPADAGIQTKSIDPGGLEPLRPVSPFDMSDDQVHGLIQAAKTRQPFSVQIGQKRVGEPQALRSSLQFKSAVSEGSITSSFSQANFPPFQSLHAVGRAFEPVRVASLFPAVNYNKQALSWLTHTGDGASPGAVAELASKTDISEEFSETTVTTTVIAGLASASLQAIWDTEEYGEANLAALIPYDLQRSVANQESLALLQAGLEGGPTGYSFNGL